MQDTEAKAFTDFCKSAKIKDVQEFEAYLYGNSSSKEHGLLQRKNDLENLIGKQIAEEQLAKAQIATQLKNVDVLENSLQLEMQKISQINGSRSQVKNVESIQQHFKDQEQKINELQKEREFVKQKQAKLRSDLEALNSREEFLQKERNITRIQETRIKHQLEEILDAAKLLKTIESVDLSQPDPTKLIKDLRAILIEKTDIDEGLI